MGNRIVLILIALALAAGAAALYLLGGEGKSAPAASAFGKPLFPQLKAAEVARITISEPRSAINLEKKDGRWTIAERGGFPADLDRVGELVVKIIELKTGQSEPISEKERARMQLGAPGKAEGAATLVSLKAQDGKVLAELLVGKKYFRSPPEGDATKAQGDGRFVMLPADPANVIVVADPLRQVGSATANWIAKEGFAIENVKSLEVKLADGGYRLERASLDAPWTLDGQGGELDPARASAAISALGKLEPEDAAVSDADAGFEQGAQLNVATFDGLEYHLKVGRLDQQRRAVRGVVEGALVRPAPPVPASEKAEDKVKREKALADAAKAFNERIAREKALGPFTLLVAKARLDDLLKQRQDLLKPEDKDAKK